MFREMRRKKQALSQEACSVVLEKGTSGVLAVSGDNDYPYAVPLSYVYDGEKIYFHCAKEGHKIDSIKMHIWRNIFLKLIFFTKLIEVHRN